MSWWLPTLASAIVIGLIVWTLRPRRNPDLHLAIRVSPEQCAAGEVLTVPFRRRTIRGDRLVGEREVSVRIRLSPAMVIGETLRLAGEGHVVIDNDVNGDLYLRLDPVEAATHP